MGGEADHVCRSRGKRTILLKCSLNRGSQLAGAALIKLRGRVTLREERKHSILEQTGIAALAQANQTQQLVLSLLKESQARAEAFLGPARHSPFRVIRDPARWTSTKGFHPAA